MAITQTDEPTPQKPLRLWPGVVAVVLQWLARFALPPGFDINTSPLGRGVTSALPLALAFLDVDAREDASVEAKRMAVVNDEVVGVCARRAIEFG